MRFRKFEILAFTDSAEFFFFRCEISKHQNRGKTFLREGMKYLTPAFVKEKSSLCGTIDFNYREISMSNSSLNDY